MADFLQSVQGDGGFEEPAPVTLVSGGAEVGTPGNPIHIAGASGGGAVTIADGGDVAQGAKADAAWDGAAAAPSAISIWKRIASLLSGTLSVSQTIQGTATDHSGTITAGGTAQQLMAANASRRGFWVQNQSTGDLYVSGLTTAVIGQPSMKIGPDQLYETPATHVNTGVISIIGATTGQAFAAREW